MAYGHTNDFFFHELTAGCDFDEEGVVFDVFSALYK